MYDLPGGLLAKGVEAAGETFGALPSFPIDFRAHVLGVPFSAGEVFRPEPSPAGSEEEAAGEEDKEKEKQEEGNDGEEAVFKLLISKFPGRTNTSLQLLQFNFDS